MNVCPRPTMKTLSKEGWEIVDITGEAIIPGTFLDVSFSVAISLARYGATVRLVLNQQRICVSDFLP